MQMTFFPRSLRFVTFIALICLFAAHTASSAQPAAAQNATPASKKAQPQKKSQPKAKSSQKSTTKKNNTRKKAAGAAAGAVAAQTNFTKRDEWHNIQTFIDDMVERHQFNKEELTTLFSQLRFAEKIIPLVKPAPTTGKPKDWQSYRARFVDPVRTRNGIQFWQEHAAALARAEGQYGVPAEIIVAIIGVETRYGRYTGNFRVLDVLTTLAFNYPEAPNRTARMAFFLRELEQSLLFARESRIDPLSLLGSYAGAIGWPQFMPGSIRAYAVDFDGDGVIDLRNSPIDAIGSVAHFLKEHGWEAGMPIGFPAVVPANDNDIGWKSLLGRGLRAISSVNDLTTVNVTSPATLPADLRYGLIDLPNAHIPTEYWLVTNNFYAITHYNRSYFYAMSVVDFSRALRTGYNAVNTPK
jgi:membrane-bound lytic murein transglycosylase B